jgi:GAF domain-containing protein
MPLGRGGTNARAILERAPVQVYDVLADPEYALKEGAQRAGFRSNLAVPMLRDDQVIGAISVCREEPGVFPNRLVRLLQTFAGQAVIAIENVRLFRETQEALDRQTATSEVLRVISESPTDVQPVLDAVAQRAGVLCQADGARVWLVRDGALHAMTNYGPRYAGSQAEVLTLSRTSVGGRAVLERRCVHVEDVVPLMDTEYPDVREMQSRYGFRTVLNVPLLREGDAVGTISLLRNDVRPFAAAEIALLQTFADQAVIAIENVRLFNETKEALEQQTATAEVLNVISNSVADTAPVFDKILDSCGRLFDSTEQGIVLVGDDGFMKLAAHHGEAFEKLRAVYAANLAAAPYVQGILRRKPVHYPNVLAHPARTPAREVAEALQIGAY